MVLHAADKSIHIPTWLGACIVTALLGFSGIAVVNMISASVAASTALTGNAAQDKRLDDDNAKITKLQNDNAANFETHRALEQRLNGIDGKLDFLVNRELDRRQHK